MDSSTLRDIKDVLIACLRYVDEKNFTREILLFLWFNNIPMNNRTSCAADGATIWLPR